MTFRNFLRKILPLGREENRERLCELEQQIYLLQKQLETMQEALVETMTQTFDRHALLVNKRLEEQRQWQETMLHSHREWQEATLRNKLSQSVEGHISWESEALEAHRQWQETVLRSHREWQEATLCNKLSQSVEGHISWESEALEAHRQWQEAILRGYYEWQECVLLKELTFIEGMLQQNMLPKEEQECSSMFRFIERMRALFPVMQVAGDANYVRIGCSNDGGYVMLDDFADRRIAYSIGIADDVSWDRDMAERGLDVYMFDHTIDDIPEKHERFHFYKKGLGTFSEIHNQHLKSLEEMLSENGHLNERGMILKVDIEGAEWDVLTGLDESVLKQFSQIVFEFHGLIFPKNEEKIKEALSRLNRTHQLVHIHSNNYGSYLLTGNLILPELIEATYLLKDEYVFVNEKRNFPTELDAANSVNRPDIVLGSWNT